MRHFAWAFLFLAAVSASAPAEAQTRAPSGPEEFRITGVTPDEADAGEQIVCSLSRATGGRVTAQSEYCRCIDQTFGVAIQHAQQGLATISASGESGCTVLGAMFVGSPLTLREDEMGDRGWILLSPLCSRLVRNPSLPGSLDALTRFQSVLEAGDAHLRRTPL